MEKKGFVSALICCQHYKVELSFIHLLEQYGLIKTVKIESDEFIEEDDLEILEKFIRMHYDLEINIPGIEAINFLLERMQDMREEIADLKDMLRIYQTERSSIEGR